MPIRQLELARERTKIEADDDDGAPTKQREAGRHRRASLAELSKQLASAK